MVLNMLSRLPKFVRICAWALGGLVIAFFLFGWFGFEPLAKWALPKIVADRSGRVLTLEQARFDPLRLAIDARGLALTEAGGKPLLSMKQLFLDLDASSLFKRAFVVHEVRLGEPVAQVELRADGRLNWLDFVDAMAGPPSATDQPDAAPPRLLLRRLRLEQGRLELSDQRVSGGFQTAIDALNIELDNISTLPEDRGSYSLSARTGIGAKLRWKGNVSLNPVTATGEIAVDELQIEKLWPYLKNRLNMAPPQGMAALALAYRVGYANRQFDLNIDKLDASVDGLALRGVRDSAPSIALDSLRARGGKFDLGRQTLAFDSLRAEGGRVSVELDAQGRPQLMDWLLPGAQPATPAAPAAAAAAPAAQPWRVEIGELGVDRLALSLLDRGFVTPLAATVGQLKLQLKARAEVGAGETQARIDGLGARIADLAVASGANAPPWLRLAALEVQDGSVGLDEREVALGRVSLSGGQAELVRAANGDLSVLGLLQRVAPGSAAAKPAPPPRPAATVPAERAWRYKVGKIEIDPFSLALRDESVTPHATLAVEGLSAALDGLSEDPKAELPMRLRFRVKQGGSFEASGRVSPFAPSADLNVKLTDLSLLPAQPFLARPTNLVLVDGKAGTQGRLRYKGGQLNYEGSFGVKALQLNEAGTNEPVLGLKSLSSTKLSATQDRLRVGEVLLDGLDSELVILKDRSVNIARLAKPAAPAGSAPPTAAPAAKAGPPYRVDVDRVRMVNGKLDFSDLSLALPFGARIHELQGTMVGLSSQAGPPAQLEFDGKVDDYGLARAAGQINLFDPTGFTDIKVIFRNVEMTSLTPYSATFAGRKIESGKLSLDLEYKVKQRQLAGENQIVMDKLTLGERVESAGAMNLPLDLALAILKDADGKIDLGLPVSGSLDDPSFSYGQIVWKAIVNVLTKVVTAPFRALGALLGVSGDKLDQIVFDGGSARLLPPEREKLANLAKLMAKRPGIGLSVRADFDPKTDGQAIQSLQLRRAVAQDAGRKLADDEDPGPISTEQPATREALERLYAKRFGAAALESLQQRFVQANPGPPPASATGRLVSRFSSMLKPTAQPLPAEEAARLKGADLHALMLQRLLDEDVVDPARLRALAARRGAAIGAELGTLGVAADRIRLEEPRASEGENGSVATALGIATGARPAGGSAAASAPAGAASATPTAR